MSRSAVRAAVLVLIVLAFTVFAGEGVHELHYANAHPGAYGPAKIIALACGAGAVLALGAGIASCFWYQARSAFGEPCCCC
jgi:hypothetical protein